ncbi:hypothetical protein [Acidisoma silvae]|nr:hypothetical protein [Acidisoma silvae]
MRDHAPWHLALFQAVLTGEIVLVMPLPLQAIPMARLATIGRPAIVLLCDDGPVSEGPAGWVCAPHAFRWAQASIINGTGGDAKIYAAGVDAAREIKRVTICDTASAHFDAWRDCAAAQGDKPILGFRPPPGGRHPDLAS